MHAFVEVCVHLEGGGQPQVSISGPCPPPLNPVLSLTWSSPISQPQGILLVLPPQGWGYNHLPPCIFMWMIEIEVGSSNALPDELTTPQPQQAWFCVTNYLKNV